MSAVGAMPAAAACTAWARPISAPSAQTAALFDMFCALNGATRTPLPGEDAAQRRRQQALAHRRAGPLDHQHAAQQHGVAHLPDARPAGGSFSSGRRGGNADVGRAGRTRRSRAPGRGGSAAACGRRPVADADQEERAPTAAAAGRAARQPRHQLRLRLGRVVPATAHGGPGRRRRRRRPPGPGR